jgi:hypothetical protein
MNGHHVRRRLTAFAVIAVFVLCAAPTAAFAWKMKTHAYSANLLMAEMESSQGLVEIPPYGWFAVDPEVYAAITAYPKAFRAGAIGPDGYPDMYVGQAYIHPAPTAAGGGTYTDEWLQQQWENVVKMPPGKARQEALAFVMGYFVHAAGDMWGHDYINDLSGGEFPALPDARANIELQSIIVRHNVTESYIDKAIPYTYTDPYSEYMKIAAPQDFVVNSLLTNGGVDKGINPLLYKSTTVPYHLRAMYATRAWVSDKIGLVTKYGPLWWYLTEWRDDVDDAIRGWASYNEQFAQAMLIGDTDAAALALNEWAIHHGIKLGPFPDIVSYMVGNAADQGRKMAEDIPTWITDLISGLKEDYI